MAFRRLSLSLAIAMSCVGGIDAGIINRNKAKTPSPPPAAAPGKLPASAQPVQRVDQLIQVLRTDPDERRRLTAVVEISKVDGQQAPQVVDALLDALRQDPSAAVRAGAAGALGRLRPMTTPVAHALEEAMQTDHSPRVKTAAKAALAVYAKAGYRPQATPTAPQQRLPLPTPLAKTPTLAPGPVVPLDRSPPPSRLPPTRGIVLQPSGDEPPLADVRPNEPPVESSPARPGPSTVTPLTIPMPTQPGGKTENIAPKNLTIPIPSKPTKPANDDGPILNGPG
jgi:hypothetical protein